jgi:hypothetical protein
MATVVPQKGILMEKGTYAVVKGTVNSDGGGAAYAADDYNVLEVLESVEHSGSVQAVKVGGGLTPRNDYTQLAKTCTIRIFSPYNGLLFDDADLGLPVKFTLKTWGASSPAAIAREYGLLSYRTTGNNAQGVMQELTLDGNPHWLVEAAA